MITAFESVKINSQNRHLPNFNSQHTVKMQWKCTISINHADNEWHECCVLNFCRTILWNMVSASSPTNASVAHEQTNSHNSVPYKLISFIQIYMKIFLCLAIHITQHAVEHHHAYFYCIFIIASRIRGAVHNVPISQFRNHRQAADRTTTTKNKSKAKNWNLLQITIN